MANTRALWPIFPSAEPRYDQHNENEFRRAVENYVRQEVERALVAVEESGVTYSLTDDYHAKYDSAGADLVDSVAHDDGTKMQVGAAETPVSFAPTNYRLKAQYADLNSAPVLYGYAKNTVSTNVPQACEGYCEVNHASGTLAQAFGLVGNTELCGAGGATLLVGVRGAVGVSGGGTAVNGACFDAHVGWDTGAGGITTWIAYYTNMASGTIGTAANWAFYGNGTAAQAHFGGGVRIGNAQTFRSRNVGGTADITMLWCDANDDTILAADSGDQLIFKIGALTACTIDNTGKASWSQDFSVSQDILMGAGYHLQYSADGNYGFYPLRSAGYLQIMSGASIAINVDADNNTTSAGLVVRKDTTNVSSGGTVLLEVNEAGWTQLAAASKLYSGAGVPSGLTNEADGDFYFRTDGGAGTSLYCRISSTWTAIA